MSPFHQLSRPALINIATALESGRLSAPFHSVNVATYVPSVISQNIADELQRLYSAGMAERHIAYTLRLLAEERESSQNTKDRVSLVWTGHELTGAESRDTSVVVRELFSSAQQSVLISSYAIDRGKKAQELFEVLSSRMDSNPNLQVRMFLNVQRPYKSDTSEVFLLKEFSKEFRNDIWPGQRIPEVFYYPRSLSKEAGPKACLHAKCIVVDEERLLITSANFTEAAHERNLEAGVLMIDPVAARAIRSQFEMLVTKDVLRRIPGL